MKQHGCRPTYRPAAGLLIVWGTLGALAGCRGPSEKLLPVAGSVTLDGQPLTFGTVSLRPDASKGNQSLHHPAAVIDAAGRYEVFTTGRKGAPPGWYKVLVFADEQNRDLVKGKMASPKFVTHIKYIDERTTDLTIHVVEKPPPGSYDLRVTK
jgi:hypothetical protein